jgi:hypothetical protein
MKLKTLGIVSAGLALGVLVTAGGCQQDDDDDMYSDRGGVTDRPVAGEPPMDEVLRTARLREAAVPVEARPAILADLGNVQITRAERVATEAGGSMYRITYIEDGQAQERVYDARGQRVIQPMARPAETIDPETAAQQVPPTTRPAGDVPPTTRPAGGTPQ